MSRDPLTEPYADTHLVPGGQSAVGVRHGGSLSTLSHHFPFVPFNLFLPFIFFSQLKRKKAVEVKHAQQVEQYRRVLRPSRKVQIAPGVTIVTASRQ